MVWLILTCFCINELVKICKNFNQDYPQIEKAINKINRYRINNGWITIIRVHPDVEITDNALYIANELEFKDYNCEKIKNYLLNYIENPSGNLKEFYYALKALHLLDRNIDKNTIAQNFKEAVEKCFESDGSSGGSVSTEPEKLIQYAYGMKIDRTWNLGVTK